MSKKIPTRKYGTAIKMARITTVSVDMMVIDVLVRFLAKDGRQDGS